jgi:hypothetical protein
MAKNLFTALQKIASEASSPVTVNEQGNQELLIAQDTAKINDVTNLASTMYPNNPDKRFAYWKKNISLDGMSNEARAMYWKQYEQMHPRGLDGAKSDFVNVTLNELGLTIGVSNKEFLLRDRIANSPPWAQQILEPELAKYSTVVANANYSKANQVYSKALQEKVNRFVSQNSLDPDISIDQHTSDFLKMEQLNLLDVASVVNGRVGAHNDKGEFIPGFALADRKMVFPNDAFGTPSPVEQVLVRNTATKPIKDALETKIINQRSDIARQERATAMEATKMLEDGSYTIDRWGEAFSINPESSPMDQVMRGLKGEIKTGRIKSEQELIEGIYTAMAKYPSMFGDLNATEQ